MLTGPPFSLPALGNGRAQRALAGEKVPSGRALVKARRISISGSGGFARRSCSVGASASLGRDASQEASPPADELDPEALTMRVDERAHLGRVGSMVLAASEIRNHEGGHGQGTTVSPPSPAMVDAAIGAAASAITVLATYL